MELKHNNPNGDIVLANKLNVVKQLFLEKSENYNLKINSFKLFFGEDI